MSAPNLNPSLGVNENGVYNIVLRFATTAGTTAPSESTWVGGFINGITKPSAGVYDIDLTCKDTIAKVLSADAQLLEPTVDGGQAAADVRIGRVYIDESLAAGLKVQVVLRDMAGTLSESAAAGQLIQVHLVVTGSAITHAYT